MSKELTPDIVEKDYWRNNDQFADLFNAVLFNGEFVIQSDSLEELDTEESQQLVHYAMPMRVMGYDYLAYKKQYDSNAIKYAGKEKRKEYGLTTDEFFSRMKQTDKFAPVITIVIYYGDKAWDGAKRLHEMLEIPPRLLPFVSDYTLNLVEARNNSFIFHNKNNKDLFELTKILLSEYLNAKEIRQKVEAYCREHKVDRSVIRMVSVALNARINYREIKEDGDMCTVFEEIRAEAKLEGRLEGKMEGTE